VRQLVTSQHAVPRHTQHPLTRASHMPTGVGSGGFDRPETEERKSTSPAAPVTPRREPPLTASSISSPAAAVALDAEAARALLAEVGTPVSSRLVSSRVQKELNGLGLGPHRQFHLQPPPWRWTRRRRGRCWRRWALRFQAVWFQAEVQKELQRYEGVQQGN
jgi:hypothetical protein